MAPRAAIFMVTPSNDHQNLTLHIKFFAIYYQSSIMGKFQREVQQITSPKCQALT